MIYNVDTFDSDIQKELSLDEKIKEYNIDSGNYVLLTKYDSLEDFINRNSNYKSYMFFRQHRQHFARKP